MTYKLALEVNNTTEPRELDDDEILYYLLQLLRGGRKLTVHYDGSGDDGDIDQVLLDNTPVGVLPLEVAGSVHRIRSDIVGWCLIEAVSDNASICISFDNEGSRGRLEVTEKDGCLVVFYDHVYKGTEHSFNEEYSQVLAPTHAIIKAYKDLLDGQNVYPEDTEELCNLLGLLGLKFLKAEKDKYEDETYIVLDDSEDEELESQVEMLVDNYFNKITSGCEDTEFSLGYQLKGNTYHLDLEVSWQESDSENQTGTLTIEFILEDAGGSSTTRMNYPTA